MDSSNLPLHLLTIDNHHLLLQQELLNQISRFIKSCLQTLASNQSKVTL
nr:hypothetical protein Q903MT_gene1766 [Picea sitchensis]